GDAPLERVVELLPRGDAGVVEGPLGVGLQLVPALVVGGGRLPEGLRIAAVDGHRHAQLARALEHRVEAGIVDLQQMLAVRSGVAEAEALGDLEADGAHLAGGRQLLGHRRAVVGDAADQPEVGRGEDGDPAAALGGGAELALERVLGRARVHAREVDHAVDSPLVHEADGAVDTVGRDVRVDVDAVKAVTGRRRIARLGRAVAAEYERQRQTQTNPARRRPRRHQGESGLISLMYGPPVSSGWALSFCSPPSWGAAGDARPGAAAERRSLAFTFSVCGLLPCGRDPSRPLTRRSLGS